MLELNKQYEARFLGCQVLTRAVTGELLSRLVHALPEVVPSGLRCTVLCSASGLTVTRPGNAAAAAVAAATNGAPTSRSHHNKDSHGASSSDNNLVTLKVALRDILFCHVDKSRPEVTVWVVRNRKQAGTNDVGTNTGYNHILPPVTTYTGGGGGGSGDSSSEESTNSAVLHAYIYRCSNSHDALGLFKVYNEMSRQSRLDKYRRNGEKRDVEPASSSSLSSSSDTSLIELQRHLPALQPPLDDDVISSSECSSSNSSLKDGSASIDSDSSAGEPATTITNSQSNRVATSPITTVTTNPSVTVISSAPPAQPVSRSSKVGNSGATSNSNPKIAAKLWGQPQKAQPDLRNTLLVNGIQPTSNAGATGSTAVKGRLSNKNSGVQKRPENSGSAPPSSPPSWASIVGSIEHYRRSFSTLRPRDKEVRAAMLAELREKLKSRHHDISGRSNGSLSDTDDPSSTSSGIPSPTTATTNNNNHSKLLASNRQRKPAKTIVNGNPEDSSSSTLQRQQHDKRKPHFLSGNYHSTPTSTSGHTSNGGIATNRAFPFPWSMSNMVKKLVHKNKHNYSGGYIIGSVSNGANHHGPTVVTPMLVLPIKGHHHHHNHLGLSMPLTNNNNNQQMHHQTPSRKFKAKKGPAPAPPIPALIKSRMATNGDSFFYLPPITANGTGSGSDSPGSNTTSTTGSPTAGIVNVRNEVFVPVLPPAWAHHNHLHFHHHQLHNNNNSRSSKSINNSNSELPPENSGGGSGGVGGTANAKPTKGRAPKNQASKNQASNSATGTSEVSKRSGALAKKKTHVIYGGLSRFARGYKKRSPPPPLTAIGGNNNNNNNNNNFVRTASTGSRGSSSSDSGAEGGKLRSVMKKPRPTNDTSPPEQKKNVTFNAYATVQVLP